MSALALLDEDYRWVSEQIVVLGSRHTQGHIVSLLEGGYALAALGRCASRHLRVLMENTN